MSNLAPQYWIGLEPRGINSTPHPTITAPGYVDQGTNYAADYAMTFGRTGCLLRSFAHAGCLCRGGTADGGYSFVSPLWFTYKADIFGSIITPVLYQTRPHVGDVHSIYTFNELEQVPSVPFREARMEIIEHEKWARLLGENRVAFFKAEANGVVTIRPTLEPS